MQHVTFTRHGVDDVEESTLIALISDHLLPY
jgi:hypothetical protein